jgi:transposase
LTRRSALLLYSYCCGICSSRRIARACRERVDFMCIVAFDGPDFRTVSAFRRRYLKALGALFTQILHLCETAGLANTWNTGPIMKPFDRSDIGKA